MKHSTAKSYTMKRSILEFGKRIRVELLQKGRNDGNQRFPGTDTFRHLHPSFEQRHGSARALIFMRFPC